MSKRPINFIPYTSAEFLTKHSFEPNVYSFRQDKGWHWLQRLCIWGLRKIGAHHGFSQQTVKISTIEPQRVMDYIFKQFDILERFYRESPTDIVLGEEDYMRLMNEDAIRSHIWFEAIKEFRTGGRPYYSQYFKAYIHIVTWMKGCVVLGKGQRLSCHNYMIG